ncbi:MAG TPA: carbonate dehydratase [Maritimibacter sp.]|nr:carbonate dehydratase [Maritimibacter sp.]
MEDHSYEFEAGLEETLDSAPRRAVFSMTLHQLRIFHAVENAKTMTSAAKQLGLTQPSLSQQLGRLESAIGVRLFDRRPNEMELTEAGRYLLPRVEQLLRILSETEDGLARFQGGYQPVVKLAGIDSVLRGLLPSAVRRLHDYFPDVSLDVQEGAPADILEMLYARRIGFGLVAANSLAQTHGHFLQIPIIDDPYVLAVPETMDLSGVIDPARELPPAQLRTLKQSIHFAFGSTHTRRVSDWYDQLMPGHQPIAQCRSFETALSLVRAGTGVCIAPALSTVGAVGPIDGVRRYLIEVPVRRVVALLLSQHRSMEPIATLIAALQDVGQAHELPELLPTPPFLADAAVSP